MNEKFDRLKIEVTVSYNRPVTIKRMQYLTEKLQESLENEIQCSEKLTKEIGHVLIGTPVEGEYLEICV